MDDKQFDYFYSRQQKITQLRKTRKYKQAESLGLQMINEGYVYPVVFNDLAMIYRKQNRYKEELDILQRGLEAQIKINNPGVAIRNFKKRIARFQQLLNKYKSTSPTRQSLGCAISNHQ